MIGVISDLLKPTYGEESLRYAMLSLAAVTPWALFHYWRAGVLLRRRERAGLDGSSGSTRVHALLDTLTCSSNPGSRRQP